jgi:hypothetical protein
VGPQRQIWCAKQPTVGRRRERAVESRDAGDLHGRSTDGNNLGSVFTAAVVIGPLNLLGSNSQMVQRLVRKPLGGEGCLVDMR